jgi:hypothetical protein
MSDATLRPPPRSSSTGPVSVGHHQTDSSLGEGDFDTSLGQSTDSATRDDHTGDSGERTDSKQKRKRTRYVWGVFIFVGTSGFKL